MSLDVYLYDTIKCPHCDGVLESGKCVYESNITHNLNKMAEEAGIYKYLWRPDEIDIQAAWELIEPLENGLKKLKSDPEHYKKFDAANGWGTYKHFVPWLQNYLNACKEFPKAIVKVSR